MTRFVFFGALLGLLAGCRTEHVVKTESSVAIQPIHITMDINLKVDRALDDFFNDVD